MNTKAIERAAQLAAQYIPGESVAEFARRLGLTYQHAYGVLRTRPKVYKSKRCPAWTKEQDAALAVLYGEMGLPISQICKDVGRSHAATKKRIIKLGLAVAE
jgi:transposase-like protein